MRKLIVSDFVTLDGVIEAPGGEPSHPHTGWVMDFMDPEQEQYKLEEVLEAGSLLLGRTTFEGFSEAWPSVEGPFGDKMNSMRKHVATTTLHGDLGWNATAIDGDVAAAVSNLKAEDGDPILVAGSGSLVHFLTQHGLVDEYRVMLFPVLIGGGLRMFPDGPDKVSLRLAGTHTFPSGVVVNTYEPAG